MGWSQHQMVAVKVEVGPTIMLHSGAWFDFCAPSSSDFTIEDIAHGGLLRCPRFVHISWRPGRRMVILALGLRTARAISTHADRRLSMAWRAPGRRLPLSGICPANDIPVARRRVARRQAEQFFE